MVAPVLFGVEILGARRPEHVALALAGALLQAAVVVVVIIVRRPLRAATALPLRGPDRQPRPDHGDHAVHGGRGRRPRPALAGLSTGARRVPGRPAAVGDRVPPPDRDRPRAVQGPADRIVLHHRRHDGRRPRRLGADRRLVLVAVAALLAVKGIILFAASRALGVSAARCRRGRGAAGAGRRVRLRRHRPRHASSGLLAGRNGATRGRRGRASA